MLKNVELSLPNVRTTEDFVLAADLSQPLEWAIRRTLKYDPLLRLIPSWYHDIPTSERNYSGDPFNPWAEEAAFAVLKDDALGEYIAIMQGDKFISGDKSKEFSFGPIRTQAQSYSRMGVGGAEINPLLTFARAASVLRATGTSVTMATPCSAYEHARTRKVFEDFKAGNADAAIAWLTAAFLDADQPDVSPNVIWPMSPQIEVLTSGAPISTVRAALLDWAHMVWIRAYPSFVGSSYLWNQPAGPSMDDVMRDAAAKAAVKERRLAAGWWRCRLDLPLYVLRSLCDLLLTEPALRRLKETGHFEMADYVRKLADRPLSVYANALHGWQKRDTGPTPLGHAPRYIAHSSVMTCVERLVGVLPATELRDPLGAWGRSVDVFPLIINFVLRAYKWARETATIFDAAPLDLGAAEAALALNRSGVDLGALRIPYANFGVIYSSGDQLSVPRLTLGDVASTPILPLVSPSVSGVEMRVGVGPYGREMVTGTGLPHGLLRSDPLPHVYAYAPTSQPITINPMMVGELDVRAIRPISEYLGREGAFFLDLADAEREIVNFLGAADSSQAVRKITQMLSVRREVRTEQGALQPIITLEGGKKITAAAPLAWYDSEVIKPWVYRLPLSGLPFVWNGGANRMRCRRATTFLYPSEAPLLTSGVERDMTAPRTGFSSVEVLSQLLRTLADALYPTATQGK